MHRWGHLDLLMLAVCDRVGVEKKFVFDTNFFRAYSYARKLFCYIASKNDRLPADRIALYLERSPDYVYYAVRKISEIVEVDPVVRRDVLNIEAVVYISDLGLFVKDVIQSIPTNYMSDFIKYINEYEPSNTNRV